MDPPYSLPDNVALLTFQVVQHGACLGLGLAALGTADEDIYDEIKSLLYTDSVIAGEASGISMGLLMVWTASEKASEMGLALGIAFTVYEREEEVDTLIEQMTRDQDPIPRYGGICALDLVGSFVKKLVIATKNMKRQKNSLQMNIWNNRTAAWLIANAVLTCTSVADLGLPIPHHHSHRHRRFPSFTTIPHRLPSFSTIPHQRCNQILHSSLKERPAKVSVYDDPF
ncbi:hypothetical protein CTI12_AA369090 [Artemisia annua]|uniref:Uncharacterized protein n=1 Tax=Artemisia annua TaxID=35608 RepID=A0A2U1MKH1_ARTAN|nr:hypothetical protein CTI12_AA369090 [Artemisia annua]